jgi:arylsulfatase A-like enzyme
MNRMTLRTILLAIFLAIDSTFALVKPNVILIVCDDLNTDIEGFGGHPQSQTPNISRLMDSGVSFQQMHCTIPICAPSRSSFFTGIYPHTSNNFGMDNWNQNSVLANSKTIFAHFKENGYRTIGTGKLMHHHAHADWDEFREEADYGPYAHNGNQQVPHPLTPAPLRNDFGKIDGSFGPFVSLQGKDFGDGKRYTWQRGNWENIYDMSFPKKGARDLTADEANAQWAVEKLKGYSDESNAKPFFMGIGFMRPHTPLIVPQRFYDQYPLESLELPKILQGDAEDTYLTKSRGGNDRGLKLFNSLVASYDGDVELALKHFTQAYLACVASVDELVGIILDVVDQSPLKDNTIIVFTSDHGWGTGPKDYVYKNSLWEESTRVPFIIRAPGVAKKGADVEHPTSLVDLYPTLIELCGLSGDTRRNEQGAVIDGNSLVPLMINPVIDDWGGPEGALTAIHKWKDMDPMMQNYSLRTKDWRYIRYYTGDEELYDHRSDLLEWDNLASNPEYTARLASFRKQLDQRITIRASTSASSVDTSKEASSDDGEKWKSIYFKKYPEADINKDGMLTWPEFKQHKSSKN